MKTTILDIETDSLPPKGATYDVHYMDFPHILSMGWKILKDEQESPTYEYIVNQKGGIVPPSATAINGITQEMCDASKFDIFTTLLQFMMDAEGSDFIIGWNLYFDTSIVKANILRLIKVGGITPIAMYDQMTAILHKDKRIDLMRVCHKLWGGKYPKLQEAYYRLFNESFNSHNAKDDVEATWRIFKELLRIRAIKIILPSKIVEEIAQKSLSEEEI